MDHREVGWRGSQLIIEAMEAVKFRQKRRVDTSRLYKRTRKLEANWRCIPIFQPDEPSELLEEIQLLGSYTYADFRHNWHAGFQTPNQWPLVRSSRIQYRGRDDIGDARTNWELNRGHQFALLAKNYMTSNNVGYLEQLDDLFTDWCIHNPFLWGIAWTSPMEVAIRLINLTYAGAFLEKAAFHRLSKQLQTRFASAIANMAQYVRYHYSRYSSANNHTIVEACALGIAGHLLREPDWKHRAQSILNYELPRQNFQDGVNKEQSLHYQIFLLEAIALYLHVRQHSTTLVPSSWKPLLENMCQYVRDCQISKDTWLIFGDDDEGSILSAITDKSSSGEFVLQIMPILLGSAHRWSTYGSMNELLEYLCSDDQIAVAEQLPIYEPPSLRQYEQGGVSILRSVDNRVVLGFDHGPLGFGQIAAHGHADALSIQLFVDNHLVIGDPGTYLYHCDSHHRDLLRATSSHSTACFENANQSEMLGPFLWGRRANTILTESCSLQNAERDRSVTASCTTYRGFVHTRTVTFDSVNDFQITDQLYSPTAGAGVISFIIPPSIKVSENAGRVSISVNEVALATMSSDSGSWTVEPVPYSNKYGSLCEGKRVAIHFHLNGTQTELISIKIRCTL
jgi:hypothetical protein